ncbi:hypothetical protein AB6A40_002967 [Gnathostoma spinigerum]|uniref:Uncharacterized protein n=1 Tax=Gnathostoma spinigerum TaxID=75299 RepID=A0ABD6EH28_9BILA
MDVFASIRLHSGAQRPGLDGWMVVRIRMVKMEGVRRSFGAPADKRYSRLSSGVYVWWMRWGVWPTDRRASLSYWERNMLTLPGWNGHFARDIFLVCPAGR